MARERAKEVLTKLSARTRRHADAWAEHQNGYFEVAKSIVADEDYTPGHLVADAWSLTLECFGMTLDCFAPNPSSGTPAVVGPGAGLALDQRNESGGPVRLPALDGPSGAPQLIAATTTSGGVPIANAYARRLPNGQAWASLVNLSQIVPGLPNGGQSVGIAGATLAFGRITINEGKVTFGSGTIPAELLNDPSLGLAELGTPTFFL